MSRTPISVITSVYNDADRLHKTLKNIFEQSTELFEYVLINDGSTDNTLQLIKEFNRKYPHSIKYESQSNQGTYSGMNRGLQLASGKYLQFIGAGDTLTDGIYTTVIEKAKHRTEILYGNIFVESYKKKEHGEFNRYKLCWETIPHPATFYHYSIFEKFGPYNLDFPVAADYELQLKCWGDSSIKTQYIDETIVRIPEHGFSSNTSDPNFYDHKEKLILNHLGKNCLDYYRTSGKKFDDFLRHHSATSLRLFGRDKYVDLAEDQIKTLDRQFDIKKDHSDKTQIFCQKNDQLSLRSTISDTNDNHSISVICDPRTLIINASIDCREPTDIPQIYHPVIITHSFQNLLKSKINYEIALFGAGECGKYVSLIFRELLESSGFKHKLHAIFDNDTAKCNQSLHDFEILPPSEEQLHTVDKIVISSEDKIPIESQLLEMGMDHDQIIPVLY